ncbi:MAG TPA: hypothetical protein PK154_08155 [Methanoregulaceae archaeon]|nr:hypothetical protein [Methanoregulaceae archaeon]HPW11068.1 hypothetical protein [Methanoregulaceae archaeon]
MKAFVMDELPDTRVIVPEHNSSPGRPAGPGVYRRNHPEEMPVQSAGQPDQELQA